MKVKGVLFIRY